MLKYTQIFLLTLSLVIFIACGSGGVYTNQNNNSNTTSFDYSEKVFLHSLFQTEYLWHSSVSSDINYALYSDAKTMTRALRVNPPDEWSFSLTKQEYDDRSNQKTAGFGFAYAGNSFRIYKVLIDSPAYSKLKRGDQILKINDQNVTHSILSNASSSLGSVATFTLLRDGNQIQVSVVPREYTFKVSLSKIINQNSKKIGYFRYDSFTSASTYEIENAFTIFHDANIDELVIDMRYNGGGSINTASILLDNITNAYLGQRQVYLDWNDNYQYKNSTYHFDDETDGNELSMQRVFFLTTENSASASELVISALRPYLGDSNIITIGSKTHGKPVGMSGRVYGNNYYFLINFFVRNHADETTSFDGISVTCSAEDDITHAMGNANETMLSSALYYIQHGVCQ